jgi:hypothetical protein
MSRPLAANPAATAPVSERCFNCACVTCAFDASLAYAAFWSAMVWLFLATCA